MQSPLSIPLLALLVGVVLGPVVLDVLDLARWGSQDIICASIVAHGVTATPLMRLYGRRTE